MDPKTEAKPALVNDASVARAAGSPMRAAAVSFLIATFIGLLGAGGFFRPLDDQLTVARARLLSRPLTGSIATVEIDSDSLKKVGVWPWPRGVNAALLDGLMAMG